MPGVRVAANGRVVGSAKSPVMTSSRHEVSVPIHASRSSTERNSRSSDRRGVAMDRKWPSAALPPLAALRAMSEAGSASMAVISSTSINLSAGASAEAAHSSRWSAGSHRTCRGWGLPRRPCLRHSTPVSSISRRCRTASARASLRAAASAPRCASSAAAHVACVLAAAHDVSAAAASAASASSCRRFSAAAPKSAARSSRDRRASTAARRSVAASSRPCLAPAASARAAASAASISASRASPVAMSCSSSSARAASASASPAASPRAMVRASSSEMSRPRSVDESCSADSSSATFSSLCA
mmetsp:Transcript_32422/g.103396  ORF Transcript_32422/g.103396 Transcript_32422/m.103396 type:complete len:301 (+) Transcript_32422:970-1872(+)